jgi:membrane protein
MAFVSRRETGLGSAATPASCRESTPGGEKGQAMRLDYRVFLDAYSRFSDHDGWALASHIALSTLTCLFPFLIFVTAVAGFLGSERLADVAVTALFATWPEQVAAPLSHEVRLVLTEGRGGLLTLGALLAVYFASSGVEALRIALDRAYGVVNRRPWWRLRLESIAFVLVGALALLTWALLVVLAPLVWVVLCRHVPGMAAFEAPVTLARLAIASVVLIVALLFLHEVLPARRVTLAEIVPGAALTFVLWAAAGLAFGAYLTRFAGGYVTTYAGLASAMLVLVFLNLLATIFVLGGELNAALIRARRDSNKI